MKLNFSITLIIILLSNLAYAEITEDMERRAEEAGIIIMRDHDVKRTYYCNDQFARETHMNMQVAYRYSQVGCLLYTSPSPRDPKTSRMPSSA